MTGSTLLSITRVNNVYRVSFLNHEAYLRINLCSKRRQVLDEEVAEYSSRNSCVTAVIPQGMISSPGQLFQGAIHLAVYGEKLSRFRNKGLLLMMLATGYTQLSELLEEARRRFMIDDKYYRVDVCGSLHDMESLAESSTLGNCESLGSFQLREDYIMHLVKNLYTLLGLL